MRRTAIAQRRRPDGPALPKPAREAPADALEAEAWPVSRWCDFETLQETVAPLEPLYGFRVRLRERRTSAPRPRVRVRRAPLPRAA